MTSVDADSADSFRFAPACGSYTPTFVGRSGRPTSAAKADNLHAAKRYVCESRWSRTTLLVHLSLPSDRKTIVNDAECGLRWTEMRCNSENAAESMSVYALYARRIALFACSRAGAQRVSGPEIARRCHHPLLVVTRNYESCCSSPGGSANHAATPETCAQPQVSELRTIDKGCCDHLSLFRGAIAFAHILLLVNTFKSIRIRYPATRCRGLQRARPAKMTRNLRGELSLLLCLRARRYNDLTRPRSLHLDAEHQQVRQAQTSSVGWRGHFWGSAPGQHEVQQRIRHRAYLC